MSAREVDLFVIGAGSGGVRAARIAAGYGAKVVIAEEYRVGGTCVIRGCVPKKLLVYGSRFAHEFEDARAYGWSFSEPQFDWPTLIANKDKEISRLEAAYVANLQNAGVTIEKSRAVFEAPHTIRLTATGERVHARHVLIATGGTPYSGLAIPGHEHVITSNEAFHLERLPERILIQGGGYIAVEFACIFAGMGAQVTLVYRGGNILRGFDNDVREHVAGEMKERGIDIRTMSTVTGVRRTGSALIAELSNGDEVNVDQVMFATGRRPNIMGLGLETAGVKLAANGGIAVDDYSQTSVPSIYAVGDVTNRVNLTPVAIREGHAFADTVFGGKRIRVDHSKVPTAVFSEPEIGTIGMTEEAARAELPVVEIYKSSFRPMRVTLSGRKTRALMKLVVDGSNDRVVGCHIVGPDAGELIQLVAVAIGMGATKADLDATVPVHPTAAEELVTMRQPTARYDSRPAAAAE
jgi:glutathione reductase (NADPH)